LAAALASNTAPLVFTSIAGHAALSSPNTTSGFIYKEPTDYFANR
jgi:hypothetical protein